MVGNLQQQSPYKYNRVQGKGWQTEPSPGLEPSFLQGHQMALLSNKGPWNPCCSVALARKTKTTHLVNCTGGERKTFKICYCCWELGFRIYFPNETIEALAIK